MPPTLNWSAATFLVALKAVALILSVPTILASPVRSEIKRGKIDPNVFLGAQIGDIQQHFTQHGVTLIETIGNNGAKDIALIETIGNNDAKDIALAYGKYGESAAFIKCLKRRPAGGAIHNRKKEIAKEKEAFLILQKADDRPGSNKLIGYTNVSRAYTHFGYLDNYCFVYSYDGDTDLFEYLHKISSDNIPLIRSLITEILSGIIYLHNAQLVHHDIKLENVAISFPYPHDKSKPKATIIDFDLAERISYNGKDIVPTSKFAGSPHYLPPEVYANKPADPTKKDVWAAGIALYGLLKKSFLFDARSEAELAHNIMNTLKYGIPSVSFIFTKAQNEQAGMSSLVKALKAMLTPDPAKRPSASECLDIINGVNPLPRMQPTMSLGTSTPLKIATGGLRPAGSGSGSWNNNQWNVPQQSSQRMNVPIVPSGTFGF
ncbi:kinase-like domain-containing protein [Syncephalis plumigaleata]|nr:kinase-like domain-containing protein [Syncephalis plumigaleata]